jgi:endonuclease/exonuclease/phosphatase (EEP) superfamily protein YafD
VHMVPPAGTWRWKLRNEQLDALAKRVDQEEKPTIVVGDFNTTPWTHAFGQLMRGKLQDSAYGRGIRGTWPAAIPNFLRIPIDHVLHTDDIRVLERELLEPFGSDHFPLYARFQLVSG